MRRLIIALVVLTLSLNACAQSTDYMALQWNYTTKEVLSGLDVADLNADGGKEIVASGSSDGFLYALSNRGAELWKSNCFTIVNTVKAADLDNVGGSEVLAGHGSLYVLDKAGDRIWGFSTQSPIFEIQTITLNGDAIKDVLLLTYDQQSCNKDSIIYAIDSAKKKDLWWYTLKLEQPTTLAAGDVNNDGLNEVIVGTAYRTRNTQSKACLIQKTHPASVQLVSASGGLIWSFITESWVLKVASADLDGDGNVEVIAGSSPTL